MKILRITALWCSSCLIMKSRWKVVFETFNEIELIDYDYDQDEKLIKQLQIGQILPVLIVFQNDIEVARIIGEKSVKELIKTFEGLSK
ncbi:MAG: thioredoxin family protein [Firmicutes bacterium]|nr:thioredoxin family protein [Bacillota bacterium]